MLFTITYRVYTTERHYADMVDELDAVSYARKLLKRFPSAVVFVAEMRGDGSNIGTRVFESKGR